MQLYNRISEQDLKQFFYKTLVVYKGAPVYIKSIEDGVLYGVNLEMRRDVNFRFDAAHVKPPGRIGMVNIDGGCVFIKRVPARKWAVGLRTDVCKVKAVGPSNGNHADMQFKVAQLNCKELGLAVLGKYPSFEVAVKRAIALDGTMAFDRQFAVDYMGNIYYREARAGYITLNDPIAVSSIKFTNPLYALLLEGKHENYPRTI